MANITKIVSQEFTSEQELELERFLENDEIFDYSISDEFPGCTITITDFDDGAKEIRLLING